MTTHFWNRLLLGNARTHAVLLLVAAMTGAAPMARADTWRTDVLTPATLENHTVEGSLHILPESGPDGEATILFADPNDVTATIQVDLSHVDLTAYDQLHFDLYMEHDPVDIHVTLRGYPDEHRGRRWYAQKRSQPLNEWINVRLDLDLDDDLSLAEFDEPEKTLTLALRRPEATGDEGAFARARINKVRLVRNLIDVKIDYRHASYDESDGITLGYPVHLTNTTDHTLTAQLELQRDSFDRFDAAFTDPTIDLEPGEQTTTTLRVSIGSDWTELPPGYAERAKIHVTSPQLPGYDATPTRGYRPVYVFGVIPPPQDKRDIFFRRTQAEAERWSDRRVAQQAERLDWRVETPPLDITPAYGMRFRCPACESLLEVARLYVYYCYSRDIEGECELHHQHVEIDVDHELFRPMLDRYHARNSEIARDMVVAWLASDDERFADKAMEILTAYERMYRELPMVSAASTGYHNRFRSATLHERHVLDHFGDTYTVLRHGGYGRDSDLDAIVDGLLSDALYNVNLHFYGASASQIDMITQAMKAAVITGQWYYLADAVAGDGGMQRVLDRNFDDDGVGVDGGDYARQAVRQVVRLSDFLQDLGIAVDRERIEQIERHSALFGFVPLPDDFEWETLVLENTGVTFLVHGEGDRRRRASINWASSRERGANDQLTYVLYDADDEALLLRTRRIAWGHRYSFLSYQSVSQNIPVIDEGYITRLRLQQEYLRDDGQAAGAIITDHPDRPAYPDSRLTRTLVLLDGCLLVLDRIVSEAGERQFDFPVYGLLAFAHPIEGATPLDEPLGQADAYQVPTDVRSKSVGDEFTVEWADEQRGVKLHFLGAGFTAFTGVSRTGWRAVERDFLLLRTHGESVTAAFLYEATHGNQPRVAHFARVAATDAHDTPVGDDQALAYDITLTDGHARRVLVSIDGGAYAAGDCTVDQDQRIAICEPTTH